MYIYMMVNINVQYIFHIWGEKKQTTTVFSRSPILVDCMFHNSQVDQLDL